MSNDVSSYSLIWTLYKTKQTNKKNTHVNFVQNQTNEQDKYICELCTKSNKRTRQIHMWTLYKIKQTNKTNTHVNFVQNQTNEQDKYTCELCTKSNKRTRQIHMWTLYKIKPNSERTDGKWQQFIKPGTKDSIQMHSDFTINWYRDNFAITIPSVDRGHGHPRNIICLVTYFISDTEQYMLGTTHGLLNSTFPRHQFMSSTFHVLSEADVDSNTEISIREAAPLQSIGNGQCCVKCSCKTGYARKLVNVWDQMFYVTRAKISDELFNIEFYDTQFHIVYVNSWCFTYSFLLK